METASSLLYVVPAEILLMSGIAKLPDQEGFRGTLLLLGGLPGRAASWLSFVISWTEVALGLAVVMWPISAVRVVMALLFLVLALYEYRLIQMKVDSTCHCFGGLLQSRPSKASLAMNFAASLATVASVRIGPLVQGGVTSECMKWAATGVPVVFTVVLLLNTPAFLSFLQDD